MNEGACCATQARGQGCKHEHTTYTFTDNGFSHVTLDITCLDCGEVRHVESGYHWLDDSAVWHAKRRALACAFAPDPPPKIYEIEHVKVGSAVVWAVVRHPDGLYWRRDWPAPVHCQYTRDEAHHLVAYRNGKLGLVTPPERTVL